jgi:hypothetical protein
MLINDPPLPDPHDPHKLDAKMFGGRAMTYYGRWTYKYEMAVKQGATAAIIVHETVPATYPWSVLANGARREFGYQQRPAGQQVPEGCGLDDREQTVRLLPRQAKTSRFEAGRAVEGFQAC